MRRLIASFLALLLTAAVAAQQSSGPVASPADLARQEQQRVVTQPYNNAPVWKNARGAVEGYASIPAPEAGVLIQDGGQNWRALRNGTFSVASGWALVVMMLVIGLFYAWKGTIQLHDSPTGRMVERFNLLERMAHWGTAISFSVLAISGLILAFGKSLLIPIIGFTLFSWLAILAKNLHNFLGPLFIISCIITFIVFVRDNLPKAIDVKWIASFGGLISGKHIPSEKFNAGEKLWFWGGLMLLGLVVGASGLVLNFPNFGQTRATMQLANLVHLTGATLFMLGAMGHIYMGTLGMAGAMDAMKTGVVDESWAKEHHEIWYDEQLKAGNLGNAVKASASSAKAPQPVAIGGHD
jgi:formate dehydrogenase subunit gamma